MKDQNNILEIIKIGCFGHSNAGKKDLVRKYIKNDNDDLVLSTVGIEYFITKRILSDGKEYIIKFYDTAGQKRYWSLTLRSVKNCDGFIFIYDINNKRTFDLINEWFQDIYYIKDENFPLILIGNKCDLDEKREVSEEEGFKAAEKYKTTYFETIAKEGINVERSINELLNKIIKYKKFQEKRDKSLVNIKLNIKKKGKYKIKEKDKGKGKEKKEKEGKGKDKKINNIVKLDSYFNY